MHKQKLPFVSWLSFIATIACLTGSVCHTAAQQMPSLPPNQLIIPKGKYTVPLHWKGDSLHNSWEPYSALLIPVKLPGITRTFYMQFDTGSPYTLFYRTELEAIQRKYPVLQGTNPLPDTVINMNLSIGSFTIQVKAAPVRNLQTPSPDLSNKSSKHNNNPIIIGTLGADLIDNKVVIIDYRRQQLMISDTLLPAEQTAISLAPFIYTMRRILFPAVLKGNKTMLYFDTGSSAFELLTDKATCFQLGTDTLHPVQYTVQSWNTTLTANTLATDDSITLAGVPIPLRHITWMEGVHKTQVAQMMKMGIGGMTGNKLFINARLLLDTRNKLFGIQYQ